MKGVIFKATGKNAYGHDLSKLFNQIPHGIQEVIKQTYQNYKSSQITELGNYKAMGADTDASYIQKQIDTATVEELLAIHANSFERWRYAYEMSDQEYFCIDFNALHTFTKSVSDCWKGYAVNAT